MSQAARQRRKREREKRDLALFALTLPKGAIVDRLIDLGELEEWDEADKAKVTEALTRLVMSVLGGVTRDGSGESDLVKQTSEIERTSAHANPRPKKRA